MIGRCEAFSVLEFHSRSLKLLKETYSLILGEAEARSRESRANVLFGLARGHYIGRLVFPSLPYFRSDLERDRHIFQGIWTN